MELLTYLFWPLPGNATYSSPKSLLLLAVCAALILGGVALRQWRKKLRNPITKKLSKSWPSTSLSFGLVGLFLVVCRVENISYLSMRFWWLIWILAAVAYLYIQLKLFRARHYEKLPTERVQDPRDKYLPKKKKR